MNIYVKEAMTHWNGEFVSQKLDLNIPEQDGFKELLGVALRKNKKRAHLLVSTVLGKHIPQSPIVIKQAAAMLSAQIVNHCENGDPAAASDSTQKYFLDILLDDMRNGTATLMHSTIPDQFTVFGYAETATSLGALVAEGLHANYIHSTRYPGAQVEEYGSFDEGHSHATQHHITPAKEGFLDNPNHILVLVDDEMTTGNTVMNTIRLFHSVTPRDVYYVATLTDLRDAASLARLEEFQEELGIKVRVFSLISTELEVPVGSVETAAPIIEQVKEEEIDISRETRGVLNLFVEPRAVPQLSEGIEAAQFAEIVAAAAQAAQDTDAPEAGSKVLVLGVEEDMYFPLQYAEQLQLLHPEVTVHSSSTTRSPVVAHNSPEYAIQDRIQYRLSTTGEKRYVYNVGNTYDQVILLPRDGAEAYELAGLITKLADRTPLVTLSVAELPLPEPLDGTTFGSYKPEDVKWLLKDLSGVKLEAPTEDREESIQTGGSHYAESLPIEYVPSAEYQALFHESLTDSADQIAEAVASLSEQVYMLKGETPVLVSLARAGTPVGVLLRRYLKAAYGYDAPHYAVSIVRGKGIDETALAYLAEHHDPKDVVFVDGWTGKGAITKELAAALDAFEMKTGDRFSPLLAVLADPGSSTFLYGTRDDYLIPSACLNSTVSGLVSRTVLNDEFIKEGDFHGAKYYSEFKSNDVSNLFVDTIAAKFTPELFEAGWKAAMDHDPVAPDWSGWKMVEQVSEEYGIGDVNLVKPGVGETTRVLLRRVPWRILVRPQDKPNLKHILMLAEQRGVTVEERDDLPYACIGLIHPKFTKGAVGADGNAA